MSVAARNPGPADSQPIRCKRPEPLSGKRVSPLETTHLALEAPEGHTPHRLQSDGAGPPSLRKCAEPGLKLRASNRFVDQGQYLAETPFPEGALKTGG